MDCGVALGLLLGPEAAAALAALQGADEERVAVGPLTVLDLRRGSKSEFTYMSIYVP